MISEIFKDHIRCIQEQVKDLETVLWRDEVIKAQELFRSHDRIIFATMGKPAFACAKIVYTARSYGLEWHELDVTHAFHGDSGIVKQGDLIVLVSKSGGTKETIEVAKHFRDWETLGVTSEPESELVEHCASSLIIPVREEGSPFGFAPMASTTLYMIVLHALLADAVDFRGLSVEDYARNHSAGKIGEALKDIGK